MRAGEQALITCPPALAYGEQGAGDLIGPNATLLFDVKVLECTPAY